MLKIIIPADEQWDEAKQEFIYTQKEQTLLLEHSLVSISKWESKWHKAFLPKNDKTFEETIDYIRCMTISPNVDQNVYNRLTMKNIKDINEYINDPMTAVYFPKENKSGVRDTVTSELIYYDMIALNIPFECQKWHLNRLLALIKVCELKSRSQKKMSRGDILSRNAALNAARRKKLGTKG